MGYIKEFGEKITVPDMFLCPPWRDVSWHNDVCPRFENFEIELAVWVDYDDPADRELNDYQADGNAKKYSVCQLLIKSEEEADLADGNLFETEDAEVLEQWLALYVTRRYLCQAEDALNEAPDTEPVIADELISLIQIVADRLKDLAETTKPVFLCIWGQGYTEDTKAIVETHDLSFFTKEKGYEAEDIEKIKSLQIGCSVMLNECGDHTVVRVR